MRNIYLGCFSHQLDSMFPYKRKRGQMLVMVLAGTVPSVTQRSPFVMEYCFSKSKITLQKWMILLHFWVHQYPVRDAMKEAEVDRRTAIDVYQWLWEICSSSLIHRPQIVLGGPGIVVQIDESLFRCKPKVYSSMDVHTFINIVFYTRTTGAKPQQKNSGFLGWLIPQSPLLWDTWR